MTKHHDQLSAALGERLVQRRWHISAAESCTGGMLSVAFTSVPGSSAWFEQGFVVYSNAAKERLLNVPAALLAEQGAVSEAVARAMLIGTLELSCANIAVAITGIAGPGGATPGKPVGMVCIAWGTAGNVHSQCLQFTGDRASIRGQACDFALQACINLLDE